MSAENYATVDDVTALWRTLTTEEKSRVSTLIPIISACLREEAMKIGKNLDTMISLDDNLSSIAKSVTVDVVARILRENTQTEPMSQESRSALGYSWSGTYAIPGGGITNAIMKNDLNRLGLRRQRYGVLEVYDVGSD